MPSQLTPRRSRRGTPGGHPATSRIPPRGRVWFMPKLRCDAGGVARGVGGARVGIGGAGSYTAGQPIRLGDTRPQTGGSCGTRTLPRQALVWGTKARDGLPMLVAGRPVSGGRRGARQWQYEGRSGELVPSDLPSSRADCPACAQEGHGDPPAALPDLRTVLPDDADPSTALDDPATPPCAHEWFSGEARRRSRSGSRRRS
jgi:hypothetical protein